MATNGGTLFTDPVRGMRMVQPSFILSSFSALSADSWNFVWSIFAANQHQRADNLVTGTKREQVDQIRKDIRNFRT